VAARSCFFVLSVALVLLAGCSRGDGRPRAIADTARSASSVASPVPPTVSSSASIAPMPDLKPLEGDWVQKIAITKSETAYIGVPVGARDKRAVFVGVHGAGDRPDWSCSEWMATLAYWAFVVCPQGFVHPVDKSAFVWGSANAIADQAERAVAALRERYGDYIADGPLIYGGWSQGATLASQVITLKKGSYDRVVLVEVGHTPLDPAATVNSFVAAGIKRAVISCSSPNCRGFAQTFEAAAKRRGLPARTNDVGNRGHWFDEPVFRTLSPKLVWLVEDEPRYVGLSAAVDARWMTD
jgi:pimeloyl-ACP methyl ester carboxylesterase